MKHTLLLSFAFGLAGLCSTASGQVVLFDDAYQNGLAAYAGGGSSTTIVSAPNPVYSGTSSMEWSGGNYSQAGVNGLGSFAEYPVLEFYRYRTSGAINTITLRVGGSYTAYVIPSDGSHDEYISFDDVPGYNSTVDQWFKVRINIAQMMEDDLFSGGVNAIQVTSSPGTDVWYVDEMQKVAVPEPSHIAMIAALGAFGLTVMLRRRKR